MKKYGSNVVHNQQCSIVLGNQYEYGIVPSDY